MRKCRAALAYVKPTAMAPMSFLTPPGRNPKCKFPKGTLADSAQWWSLHFMPQYYSVHLAFELMEKHEKQNDMRFDWVIRVRPDLVYPRRMNPICFYDSRQRELYHHHVDYYMMMPRRDANTVIDAWHSYWNCKEDLT